MERIFLNLQASLAPTTAAISSNLKSVIVFNGATLFLAIIIADLFLLQNFATHHVNEYLHQRKSVELHHFVF